MSLEINIFFNVRHICELVIILIISVKTMQYFNIESIG